MSTIAIERTVDAAPNQAKSPLRMLALVPPCKQGKQLSRYSFLTEELRGFLARGVEVHLVSRQFRTCCRIDGAYGHPIPPLRNAKGTINAAYRLALPRDREWTRGMDFVQRLTVARSHEAIAKVIRERTIDVVYSPFLWPNSLAGIPAAERLGVPVVVSLRGADTFDVPEIQYGPGKDSERSVRALKAADHVVGVSSALVNKAIEHGTDSRRTSIILKGVDLQGFSVKEKGDVRRQLGIADRPTLLYVGNLVPVKGVALLIPALRSILNSVPNVQLIVCGEGELRAEIEAAARREGIAERVSLVGRIGRETICSYFQACDLLVLPSLSEGSGNVLIEAGACAKPVVAANVGGIPDYVDDGVTGYLFSRGDSKDLAAKAVRLLSNPEMAKQFGLAGRERVERQHTFDGMIDQLLDLFTSVVLSRGRS